MRKNIRNLQRQIEIEIKEGDVLQLPPRSFPAEDVNSAVRESLAAE